MSKCVSKQISNLTMEHDPCPHPLFLFSIRTGVRSHSSTRTFYLFLQLFLKSYNSCHRWPNPGVLPLSVSSVSLTLLGTQLSILFVFPKDPLDNFPSGLMDRTFTSSNFYLSYNFFTIHWNHKDFIVDTQSYLFYYNLFILLGPVHPLFSEAVTLRKLYKINPLIVLV